MGYSNSRLGAGFSWDIQILGWGLGFRWDIQILGWGLGSVGDRFFETIKFFRKKGCRSKIKRTTNEQN